MVQPGDSLDRYTVEDLIGSGGMGAVHRAHDMRLNRRVAIKFLTTERKTAKKGAQAAAARLLREARNVASFNHPNAVTIYDVAEVDGSPYIVMELIEGMPLRSFVGAADVTWQRKLDWLIDVARVLGAAHESGLVHRDVKPDNVMVRTDGLVKVLDFGIARRAQAAATGGAAAVSPAGGGGTQTQGHTVRLTGSLRYMAPEQIDQRPEDGRTDQFSWGVMAHELLTGVTPWDGEETRMAVIAAIMMKQAPTIPSLVPEIPEEIEQIIRRSMSKASADRFEKMRELVEALEAARGLLEPKRDVVTPAARVSKRYGWPVLAALVVAGIGGGVILARLGAASNASANQACPPVSSQSK